MALLLAMVWTIAAYAQQGRLYTGNSELSSSLVRHVYQDKQGYIWISTMNGLCRYDGYQFYTYQKKDGRSQGMLGNLLNCVAEDARGQLYIGYSGGLQMYADGRFETVSVTGGGKISNPNVSTFCRLGDGTLLAATTGYGILKVEGKTAKPLGGIYQQFAAVRCMMQDRDGWLWVVTDNNGIAAVKGRKCRSYMDKGELKSCFGYICQDRQGNIFAASWHGGLYRLDSRSKGFTPVKGTEHLPLTTLLPLADGRLLMGTDGCGVWVFDSKTGAVRQSVQWSPLVNLSAAKVSSIMEDRQGNLWIGMLQKGLYMQPRHESPFRYMGSQLGKANTIGEAQPTCILIDRKGRYWMSADNGGVYIFDSKRQPLYHYKRGERGTVPPSVLWMTLDRQGRVWAGCYLEGCGTIDPATGAYRQLDCTRGAASNVFDVKTDKDNRLWIGTLGYGLICYDIATGKAETYKEDQHPHQGLPNDYIMQMRLSLDSTRLYVGTSTGLGCLELATRSWTSVFRTNCILSGLSISDICEDEAGNLWVATHDGLYKINCPKRGRGAKGNTKVAVKRISTADGLPDNTIQAIQQGRDGCLWVSTAHGLCRYNPKTNQYTNYYAGDGLMDNEFTDGVAACSPDGTLWFGTMTGIVSFRPGDVVRQTVKPTLHLVGLQVNGERRAGIEGDSFCFDHNENNIQLYFSTFNYDNPERIVFKYKVNDDDWVSLPAGQNAVGFSRLGAGTYRIRVKAIDGAAESDTKELTVTVSPVWYLSTAAYIVYLLFAIGLVALYLRHRKRLEQERLQRQEARHAEELGEAKIRFFINMSHEIRTPMTLILTPLLSLLKSDTDAQRHSVYDLMRRNAERILHIINQMMDLRKIDKGQMRIHTRETDYVGFIEDIYNLFDHQAKTKRIRFTFNHDTDHLPVYLDVDQFDKAVVNVLSNAFKFTPTNGSVAITLSHDDRQAVLSVKDSGCGIPEDQIGNIFQRFYQATSDTAGKNIGTGVGLDLTRSLVELHYGTITARNNSDGKGAEFVITLPLGKEHLKPEEIVDTGAETEGDVVEGEDLAAAQGGIDVNDAGGDGTEEPVSPTVAPMSSQKRPHIVVVEDDVEIADYLESQLKDDYRVSVTHDGTEALPVILQQLPDLVISDVMMPQMDGTTLATKVKCHAQTNDIPIILLTAKTSEEDQLDGLQTGADAYLMKPFNMDILRRTIINLLAIRRVMRNKFSGRQEQDDKTEPVEKTMSPDEKLLERIMKSINNHLSDSEITVEEIANEVGISRIHLNRKMKELTNQTPHNFIRDFRLRTAGNLLRDPHQNITEVMYRCGFSNLASFSTMFKNFYGLSPREFQRQQTDTK